MKLRLLSKYVLAGATGLILTAAAANAQLMLNRINVFGGAGPGTFNTTNTLVLPASAGTTFSATPDALPINLIFGAPKVETSTFTFTNTVATAGASGSFAFTEQFDFAGGGPVDLTLSYNVTWTATNSPVGGVDFNYSILPLSLSGNFTIDGTGYVYAAIGDNFTGSLNTSSTTGHLQFAVNVVAVPESSTYGMFAGLGLAAFAGYRRIRAGRKVA